MATFKEIDKNKVQVTFEITAEAINNAKLEAYKKNKGKFPASERVTLPRAL